MIHFLRRDESSHWYLVPKKELKDFDKMHTRGLELDELSDELSDEWYDLVDEFDTKFSQYRLSGGPYDVPINK